MIDLKEHKEQLVMQIQSTADWTAQKAEEYPNDAAINLNAQEALTELSDHIENLPDDHPLFQEMEGFWDRPGDNGDRICMEENDDIRAYGFQVSADPEAFVVNLLLLYSTNSLKPAI